VGYHIAQATPPKRKVKSGLGWLLAFCAGGILWVVGWQLWVWLIALVYGPYQGH
jgi:hypothetical protein